jgi:TPP-dependent 2-oxoacid decarboxylase
VGVIGSHISGPGFYHVNGKGFAWAESQKDKFYIHPEHLIDISRKRLSEAFAKIMNKIEDEMQAMIDVDPCLSEFTIDRKLKRIIKKKETKE